MGPMRELTFKGFLSAYVKKLSYAGSLNMSVIAQEAIESNPRLRAPLVLYAVLHGKSALLRKKLIALGGPDELLQMLDLLCESNAEELLKQGKLPDEYLKVWTSFTVRHERLKTDSELKSAMREKIIELQKSKKCSNYRLYRDLKLNPGNINSWLKNGDGSKVSYQTAERIITYVMQS